jgi:nicotinamidase-related amidase
VVHCTAEFRADRVGSPVNCSLVASMIRNPDHLLVGSAAAEVVPEFGPAPGDLFSSRLHGVSPFTGTSLDPLLRSLGVTTVVATGASVNLGVLGLAIEAVNLGYTVVIPRDAVVGVPQEYADALLDHTYPMIATLTTVDAVLAAWADASER